MEADNTRYYLNIDLLHRFVNDFKVPIESVNPDTFVSVLKWNLDDTYIRQFKEVCEAISVDYDGNVTAFLDDYYYAREKLIKAVKDNPEYINISKNYSKDYVQPCDELLARKHKNVYNNENAGKWFISIDIKEANFNALRFINPAIFDNAPEYSVWVYNILKDDPRFTNSFFWINYFFESKYSRQVIFGQCNPKFHINVEQRMMNMIGNEFFNSVPDKDRLPVYVDTCAADEIVFGIKDEYTENIIQREEVYRFITTELQTAIKNVFGDKLGQHPEDTFKITLFQLNCYELYNKTKQRTIQQFYVKNKNFSHKLYNIHKRYALIAKLILSGCAPDALPDVLTTFDIDGINYKMTDTLSIKPVN